MRSSTRFRADFARTHVDWDGARLVICGAAMEPLAEGCEAYLSAEPKRVVLLEETA